MQRQIAYNPDSENAKWALLGGLLVVAGGLLIRWATGDAKPQSGMIELIYCAECEKYHIPPECEE